MLEFVRAWQITGYSEEGKPIAKLDLQASEYSDLPSLGGEAFGYVVAAGTNAQVTHEGGFVTLDADGDWYDTSGNAVEDS